MTVARSTIALPWSAALVLAVALAAFLRLLPPIEWEGGDAENYACIAWKIAGGESVAGSYSGPPHEPEETIGPRAFAIRPAVTFPAAWLLSVLPAEPWGFAAWPMLLGLSEVVLAMLFGRRLWGERAGVLSGLLVACLPLAVSEARALRADLPAAVLLGWGVFLLWGAAPAPAKGVRFGRAAAAGLLIGLSWLAKETLVLAVPALAGLAAISVRREGSRGLMTVLVAGLAALAVLALESMAYAARFDDPLFRFHELARNFEQCRENFFYADSPAHGWPEGGYGAALLARLAIAGPSQLLLARPTLAIGLLGLVAGLVLWRRRDASALPVLAWLVLLGLAFNFGSTSVREYRPVVPASTYFYPIVLPACLLCGAAVARWDGSRVVRGAFAAFVATAGVLSLAVNADDRRATVRLEAWSSMVPDGDRVAIDFRGVTTWSYLRGGAPVAGPDTVPFEAAASPDAVDWIVVRDDVLGFLRRNYRYTPPAWVARLGEDRRVEEIARSGEERLFRVRDARELPAGR